MIPKSRLFGECFSEFLGTAILITFGTSCVAARVLADAELSQWEISIIWGLAVSMAIYITGGISGAHINPAVTLAMAFIGRFRWRKVFPYIISQTAGAFIGAMIAYFLYSPLFHQWELEHHVVRGTMESLQTAAIFTTFPATGLSTIHAFFVEIIITAMLLLGVMALTDSNNQGPKGAIAALLVGLLVALIGASTGPLTGFALNPARDFGPRFFEWLAGWGNMVFTGGRVDPYFWVPVIGPLIGGILGALLYQKGIARYLAMD